MRKLFLLLITIFLFFTSYAQTFYWKIEVEGGEELLLTMCNHPENMTFEAYTRKDALKELAGTITYLLARAAGKVKFPELVHSFGKYNIANDTTYYAGSFDYLDKSFQLNVKTSKNSLIGKITDNKKKIHPLNGQRLATDRPLKDYPAIISKTHSLTEKYHFDAGLKQLSEWQNFKSKVKDLEAKIADDWELAANYYWYGKNLPIANYRIDKTEENPSGPNKSGSFRTVKTKTALLDVFSLSDDGSELDQIFRELQKRDYNNLIIDARGKKNLSLATAFSLANHLSGRPIIFGNYLTRKWTDSKQAIPVQSEVEKSLKNFSLLQNKPNQIYTEPGVFVRIEPSTVNFKGKIYLLADSKTSNTAEALAIALKNEKIATVVGTKTSGAPMLTELFQIEKRYQIFLQTAQYYDRNGKSYFNQGIEPDLKVPDEDALNFLLRKIN